MENILAPEQKIQFTIFLSLLLGLYTIFSFFIPFNIWLSILFWAAALVILWRYPQAGISAAILLTMIFERFFTLTPVVFQRRVYPIYPLDILLLLSTLLILLKGSFVKTKLEGLDKSLILFISFSFLVFLFSLFRQGSDFLLALSTFKNYAFYSIFYFLIVFAFNREDLKILLRAILWAGILIIAFLVWGLIAGQGLWSQYTPLSTAGRRLLAPTHGFYLSFPLLILLSGRKFFKISPLLEHLIPLLSGIWLLGIFLTASRHLWIMTILEILILLCFNQELRFNLKDWFKKPLVAALLLGLLLIFLAELFPFSSVHLSSYEFKSLGWRVYSLFSGSSDASVVWRLSLWGEAFKRFLQRPFLGIGFGQRIEFLSSSNYLSSTDVRNLHNSLFGILLQEGILGALLFSALLFFALKKIFANKEKARQGCLLALLLGFLFASFFGTYLEINLLALFFFFILGLVRALPRLD